MKLPCRTCGCHFPQDFSATQKLPCNLWGDMGAANLPTEFKSRIWDWFFSFPSDEIAGKFNIGASIKIGFVPINPQDQFANLVPGYADLSEEEQQDLQREYFKKNNLMRVQPEKRNES